MRDPDETTVDILIQRREMIAEYFSITITSEGILTSLPLLLRNYTPCYGKLPYFLRRLGRNVPPPFFPPSLTLGRLVY